MQPSEPASADRTGIEWAPVARGAFSLIPFAAAALAASRRRRSHAKSARYWNLTSPTYSLGQWVKDQAILRSLGMPLPRTVAEIGPGDSLGLGIAALLSGVQAYYAFDIGRFALPERDAEMVAPIAALLRAPSPEARNGWPDPHDFIEAHDLHAALFGSGNGRPTQEREESVRRDMQQRAGCVHYVAPWTAEAAPEKTLDLVVSHSALEYVEDLDALFARIASVLRPGGWTAHQVDTSSVGVTRRWNGHLAYPPWLWRLVKGRRPHTPNRALPGAYRSALARAGFDVLSWQVARREDGLRRQALARPFRDESEEDLACCGFYFVARLRAGTA